MFTIIINTLILVIAIAMTALLYSAYKRSKATPVYALILGMVILATGFIADIIGRLSGDITLASYFFRFYAGSVVLTLIFIKAYVELSRKPWPTYNLIIYSSFVGALFVLRLISHLEIIREGALLTRTGFSYEIFGIDINAVLLLALVMWVVADTLWLSLLQYKRASKPKTKTVLKIEIGLFIFAILLMAIDIILVVIGLLPDKLRPLFINIPIFVTLFTFTFSIYTVPYIPYLTVQEVYGVLIFNKEGVLITKYIVSKELDEAALMLGGFFSAIASALEETLKVGKLRRLGFVRYDVVLDWGERVLVALFVRNPLRIHYTIVRSMIEELDQEEIPEIIDSNIEQKIKNNIQKHLDPLFP